MSGLIGGAFMGGALGPLGSVSATRLIGITLASGMIGGGVGGGLHAWWNDGNVVDGTVQGVAQGGIAGLMGGGLLLGGQGLGNRWNAIPAQPRQVQGQANAPAVAQPAPVAGGVRPPQVAGANEPVPVNARAAGQPAPAVGDVRPPQPQGANAPAGRWQTVNESMSARARAYQTQVTGRTGEAYVVDGVRFDGVSGGTLLDAKGPGYATFVRNGQFRPWYQGAQDLVAQARRQVAAANGAPITWHVAEADAATAMRNLLQQNNITGITVVHTPVVP